MSNSLGPLTKNWNGSLQARILEWVAIPFSRGSSQSKDWTQVSCIAGRFFTSWATGEAQEYWRGSLSLLQQIFPTQGLNQGLLHCRQILCQLSYQGSPEFIYFIAHTKNSLKWILDHNLKVIKLLEENLGENLNLEIVPPKKLMRKKTWFIWILNYCSLKNIAKKMKRRATN